MVGAEVSEVSFAGADLEATREACARHAGRLVRDSRTNCEWQSFSNDHGKFADTFPDVMHRLSVLGQDESKLIDCTEVVRRSHFLRPAGN